MRAVSRLFIFGTLIASLAGCSDASLIEDAVEDLNLENPVIPNLVLSPLKKVIPTNAEAEFAATGGVAPYVFDVFDGPGNIGASSGVYVAPTVTGNVVLRVRDQRNSEAFAFVEITEDPIISPSELTLAITNKFSFSVAGGRPPYNWSIASGSGSVNAVGLYSAGEVSGTSVLRVTDAAGRQSDASITINPAVSIQPKAPIVAKSESINFSALGGIPPYKFKVLSGAGSINDATGVFFAPNVMGIAAVQVEDKLGNLDVSIVTISNPLRIDPPSLVLVKNSLFDFRAQGGTPPYSYSVSAGSIDSATGRYTAPGTAGGPHAITVTDAKGQTSSAQATINDSLQFVVQNVTVTVNQSYTFAVTGGVGPTYFFSVPPSQGSFTGYTYTAPSSPGIYTVTVQDSQSPTPNVATATVIVNPALAITPVESTIAITNQAQFVASGGVPPYSFAVPAGGAGGSIHSENGLFSAGTQTGDTTVTVSDSYSTSSTVIHIGPALVIDPSAVTLVKGTNRTFATTGGVGAITFSVTSGGGSIESSLGQYTASNTTGIAKIRAQDVLGNSSEATVSIVEPLGIVPGDIILRVGSSMVFSAAGGLPPYSYSIVSDQGTQGTINETTGAFNAPGAAGVVKVRVTDAMGNTSDSTVTVFADLIVAPPTKTMAIGKSASFSAIGGVPPYIYSVVEGPSGGVINSTTGQYTAPAIPGNFHIRVTDMQGLTSDAAITVNAALSISPATKILAVNNGASFTPGGGVPPYRFAVISGLGTIISATGDYSAPGTSGSATIRVTDADDDTADASVTINGAIEISPTSKTLAVNDPAFRFSATGGVPPYTYSVSQGVGSVVATGGSAGDYTSASPGTATIKVTDALGNHAEASVSVSAALAISPATKTLAVTKVFDRFSATGGLPPYTYSIVEGVTGGSIGASTGVYTAPAAVGAGSYHVRVTDSLAHTSDATITVTEALAITPASKTIIKNGTIDFDASGGVPPYSFMVMSGGGTIVAASGLYTAPGAAGTGVVRVTDSFGSTVEAAVTVNNTLAINPSSKVIVINGMFNFSATGGIPPYTFSKLSGDGIIAADGEYTAPAAPGNAVIRVTDSDGTTSDANVTINNVLSISPAAVSLSVNNTQTFTSSGGIPPYVFSVVEGTSGGSVVGATGAYTAPSGVGSGTYHVRVTDSAGTTSDATVTLSGPLAISPNEKTLAIGDPDFQFTASGGVPPYTYSKLSGLGSIVASGASLGTYTVPGSSGGAVVRVTDSLSNTSDATITITNALQISPTAKTLAVNNSFDSFTATGGTPPYSYSVVEGVAGGSVIAGSGAYTAPANSGTYHVRVTDSLSHTSEATITVNGALSISPTSATLAINATQNFTATGGVAPYVFSRTGGGTIADGLYTAPSSATTATVTVTDSLGNTSNASVTVQDPPTVASVSPNSGPASGGTAITLTGTGFRSGATVSLGGSACNSVSVVSAGQIDCVTTLHAAGAVNVTVTNTDSQSGTKSSGFTYIAAPTVTSVTPIAGALGGGTSVTITGSGFQSGATVDFGGSDCTPVTFTSPSQISCTTTAHSAGAVTVTVTNPDAQSGNKASAYTFQPAPTVTAVAPNAGSDGGGTAITITGTNFLAGATVDLGGATCGSTTVASDTQITCTTVGHAAGAVNVTVTNSDTQSGSLTGGYTYTSGPVTISPSNIAIGLGSNYTFSKTGGSGPFTFSLVSGVGSINSSTGTYLSYATGNALVRVTDSLGGTSDATIQVIDSARVSLLMHFEDSLTTDSSPSPKTVSTVSGGPTLSASRSKFGAKSAYFDGSAKYLSATGNTDMGSSDFTVDHWVYLPAPFATREVLWGTGTPTSNYLTNLSVYANGSISFGLCNGACFSFGSAAGVVTANTWHHIALVRTDNTWTIYVNGNSVASTTNASAFPGGGDMRIGSYPDSAYYGVWLEGNIDEFRVSRFAQWKSNFIPPTSALEQNFVSLSPPLLLLEHGEQFTYAASGGTPGYEYSISSGGGAIDPITGVFTAPTSDGRSVIVAEDSLGNTSATIVDTFGQNLPTSLKLRFDGSLLTDSSESPKTVTVTGTPTYTTGTIRSGSGAAQFNGGANYLRATGNTDFGTSDFTIDTWVKIPVIQSPYSSIWGSGTPVSNYMSNLAVEPDGTVVYGQWNGTYFTFESSAGQFTAGAWNHVALVRNANNWRIYLNGNKIAETNSAVGYPAGGTFYIGTYPDGTYYGYYLNGFLDNFRITRSARWTDNFAIPPPAP